MGLWHLVSVFRVRTDFPCHGCNSKYDKTHNGSIRFPIVRLRIPAPGWRPDMLGITKYHDQPMLEIGYCEGEMVYVRNFASSTHIGDEASRGGLTTRDRKALR